MFWFKDSQTKAGSRSDFQLCLCC